MAHIGAFGVEAPAADLVEFEYFGEAMRANPGLGELDFVDFMAKVSGMGADAPGAVGVVKDFAEACIHPDDFEKFWRAAKTHRQSVEDVSKVLYAIIEAVTARPTGLPSDSSAGLPSTPVTSEDAAFSAALSQIPEGRPDLALGVVRALDAKRAS